MAFSAILDRFMELSPISVMVRAISERVLTDELLDNIFEETAGNTQYTRDLTFSSIFELMSLVVLKTFPSINSAYQSQKNKLPVSITAVYDKLNGINTDVSSATVRETGKMMSKIIHDIKGERDPLLPGYQLKFLDGNCIEGTEHRLEVLRDIASSPLPGKSLVVYDPALEMATEVIPCEDGHAQERSLLEAFRKTVVKNDAFFMDRNFCVNSHLVEIENRGAFFGCRWHKQFSFEGIGDQKRIGKSDTGEIFDQWVHVPVEGEAKPRKWRCITVKLKNKTRDGDKEIKIITNLSKTAAPARVIAQLYRRRWNIETMFQELEGYLHSEINTLGYPKAALFGFCVALVAHNIMAVIKAAMRSVHGEEKIANEVSGYYIAGEITRTYEGMNLAILPDEWKIFAQLSHTEFINTILRLAHNIQLELYKKHSRGPKKNKSKPAFNKDKPHVSTAKLLNDAKSTKK